MTGLNQFGFEKYDDGGEGGAFTGGGLMGGFKEWSERLRPGEENTRPPLLLRGAEPRERERERAAGGEAPRLAEAAQVRLRSNAEVRQSVNHSDRKQ